MLQSERHVNKMVMQPGCEGREEFSLHTKNVRSVWFVVKRRGCCCNLFGGVALIVWCTTNGMCGKNNTICVARASNSKRDCKYDLYCCLLPRCEALRIRRSGFPIATILSGVNDGGQRGKSPALGKLNVKIRPPLSLYFCFTIILVFSRTLFFRF